MSRTAAKRYWNPVGMVFAAVFLSGGTLFAGVAAVSAGWIQPPAGAPTDIGFGPIPSASCVLASLWVTVTSDDIRVRGVFRGKRLRRVRGLTATHEFRTRPTGLRLTVGDRSVLVYPRPRGADDLIRTLGAH